MLHSKVHSNVESHTEGSRVPISCGKNEPVNEEATLITESPTVKDLENYIDESSQSEVMLRSVTDNMISRVEFIDSSTPLLDHNPAIDNTVDIIEEVQVLKQGIKLEFTASRNYIFEQNQTIEKSDQMQISS